MEEGSGPYRDVPKREKAELLRLLDLADHKAAQEMESGVAGGSKASYTHEHEHMTAGVLMLTHKREGGGAETETETELRAALFTFKPAAPMKWLLLPDRMRL